MANASRHRGDTARCRPRRLPPQAPLTTTRSPARAPSRRQARPGGVLPTAVIETTSGPSQALVSPPASTTPCSAARARMPSRSPRPIASPCLRGRATAAKADSGRAAMAARSLRFTARALWPTCRGEHSDPSTKSVPSMSMSTVTTVRRSAGGRSTAASSPGGTSNRGSAGIRARRRDTKSSSIPQVSAMDAWKRRARVSDERCRRRYGRRASPDHGGRKT